MVGRASLAGPPTQQVRDEHDKAVVRLSQLVKSRPGALLSIRRRPEQSHCARVHNYKRGAVKLDLSGFTKVLGVEELRSMDEIPPHLRKLALAADNELVAIADVQAMISFEELVDALLPMGLIPAVVPEFKGITVGGSLQGLAAESTSFVYGFVHDVITGFEALLGDGTVLWCSPTSNAELYYSLPGSFGSLAICTRIRVLCIKAKPFVRVTCRPFASQSEILAHMSSVQDAAKDSSALFSHNRRCDMIEGIGFGKKSFVAVEGTFSSGSDDEDENLEHSRCNLWGYKWFYNQVHDKIKASTSGWRRWFGATPSSPLPLSSTAAPSFLLPTKDYLFRHDRGSFFMASYRIPQIIGQFLMGPLLDNSAMFHLANLLPWAFPKSQIVLQDFMLPRSSCESFFTQSDEISSVWPIWLLPMRNFAANQQEEKTAVFGARKDDVGDLCNVGVYGIPRNRYSFEQANKLLEAVLFQHGGRKVYYSHSFYDREFFYNTLYNGQRYFGLRKKYGAEGALPEMWDKIVVKDGVL